MKIECVGSPVELAEFFGLIGVKSIAPLALDCTLVSGPPVVLDQYSIIGDAAGITDEQVEQAAREINEGLKDFAATLPKPKHNAAEEFNAAEIERYGRGVVDAGLVPGKMQLAETVEAPTPKADVDGATKRGRGRPSKKEAIPSVIIEPAVVESRVTDMVPLTDVIVEATLILEEAIEPPSVELTEGPEILLFEGNEVQCPTDYESVAVALRKIRDVRKNSDIALKINDVLKEAGKVFSTSKLNNDFEALASVIAVIKSFADVQ